MMRAVRNLLLATAAMAALPGCAAMATSPVSGFLYTDVSGPMTATSNSASSKKGEAECSSILGLIAMGDCSIQTAASEAGISQIHHVDYKSKNILGLYATFTIVVYGE